MASEHRSPPPRSFHTTHWSVVRAAGAGDSRVARRALENLCETYWFPLYAFVRRSGADPDAARDLTQGFFARLIEKRDYLAADPDRGRFRSFLLAALKHYLANQRARERALKRGGGRELLPIDFELADERYRAEPGHDLTPERAFERNWARALLARTFDRLGEHYHGRGQGALFERLRDLLVADADGPSRSQIAATLGMTEGALKVALHRMRQRFREQLRHEVAETVTDPETAQDELRHLLTALSSP